MMFSKVLQTILLAATVAVHAAPAGIAVANANFDDLKGANVLATQLAPDNYKGLNYSQFRLSAAAPFAPIALKPSSLNNDIVSLPLATGGNIELGTGTQLFNLQSLTAGCFAATQNSIVSPPVACTLKFTGKPVVGAEVSQSFQYKVNNPSGVSSQSAPTQLVTFNPVTFAALTELRVEVVAATFPPGIAVQFALDDVKYTYVTV